MASIVKILRVAADPNRLRILMLLRAEELSVAELQEILAMGQSTISTHLAQLKQAGLVEDRRTGKSNLYHLIPMEPPAQLSPSLFPSGSEHEYRLSSSSPGFFPPEGGGENSPNPSSRGLIPPEGEGDNNRAQFRSGQIPPQEENNPSTPNLIPPDGEGENSPNPSSRGLIPPEGEHENSPRSQSPALFPPEGEQENSPGQVRRGGRSPGNTSKEITAPRRGAANVLNEAGFSPYIAAAEEFSASAPQEDSSALKGPGLSRADHATKAFGASAPEPLPTARTFLDDLLARAAAEIPQAAHDQAAMRRVLRKRQDKTRAFFDSVAGRLGRDYVPGKSWKSLAEALLGIMPPMTIADLGAGEGAFALLLAARARKVIAVDSSARMIDVGREQAARHGLSNIDFRLGDMEELPIGSGEVDLVFFSQSLHHALHPARALEEAWRILAPGGRIAVLDLAKHRFEEARELYADEWLGFSEAELESMLEKAGFTQVTASIVDKEPETPQFQTLLGIGAKPI